MKINKNELRVLIDVDGTLISSTLNLPSWRIEGGTPNIAADYYGTTKCITPMRENIELLKAYKKEAMK